MKFKRLVYPSPSRRLNPDIISRFEYESREIYFVPEHEKPVDHRSNFEQVSGSIDIRRRKNDR